MAFEGADAGLKVIIPGATGMVGEGVLLACLDHPATALVLMVNRRSFPLAHARQQEPPVPDFLALDGLDAQLSGYDARFYCARISFATMPPFARSRAPRAG